MTHDFSLVDKPGRRDFLKQTSLGNTIAAASSLVPSLAAAVESSSTVPLPTIRLGSHQVTRLIAGGNPIGGFSHSTQNMSRHMLEYFTLPQTVEFLNRCLQAGINTWQFDHLEKPVAALRAVREQGGKLNFICLHAEREKDAPIKTVIADMNPIAMVHHGGVTDRLFRTGQAQQVRDFVKKVQDQGLLAGVSSHCPENIKRMADQGWENDLFMTCFYYVSRTKEEERKLTGKMTVGEPFFESDPEDMTGTILQVGKPCLAFKILAAGRLGSNQGSVEKAFQYAFQRIKKTDAVIVGMYPRFEDEVRYNAEYVRKYGVPAPR